MDCLGNCSRNTADFQEVVGGKLTERCLRGFMYAKPRNLYFSTGTWESLKDFKRGLEVISFAFGKTSGRTLRSELERMEHLGRKKSE